MVNGKSVLGGRSSITPVTLQSKRFSNRKVCPKTLPSGKYFLASVLVRTTVKGSVNAFSGFPEIQVKPVFLKSKIAKNEGSTIAQPRSSRNFLRIAPDLSGTST